MIVTYVTKGILLATVFPRVVGRAVLLDDETGKHVTV
jgi:hypothetical protein